MRKSSILIFAILVSLVTFLIPSQASAANNIKIGLVNLSMMLLRLELILPKSGLVFRRFQFVNW